MRYAGITPDKVNLHYVMGVSNSATFHETMKTAASLGFHVALLGFKTTGRGAEFKSRGYEWLPTAIERLKSEGYCPAFSIDTQLAQQMGDKLTPYSWAYTLQEGAFSCYIDAVNMTMAKSSYEPKDNFTPFDKNWLTTYKEY